MSDQDVDDVAFLTVSVSGDSQTGINKRSLYEHNGVAVCSQKRALLIATVVFATLFVISLIIAYAGPQSDCPCAGEKPEHMESEAAPNTTSSPLPLSTNGEVFPWNSVRLPTFVHPTRYSISIHPNLTTLDVKGQVIIEFTVEKETPFIVFHSKNLTLAEKLIVLQSIHSSGRNHRMAISRLLEYPAGQQIYLEARDKFRKKVNYTLSLRFTSRLSRELEGFYLSSYVTKDGERKYLATTHFEPTYARSAFPCFDEPQFKARFKMSIFRDRFHIALFNMPVKTTEDAGFYMGTGLLRDDFWESVEMSTYLVAFVVCDYDYISSKTNRRDINVSVYAPRDLIPQAKFALKTATDIMDYYEDFFRVQYPLPKQDLIAIPDFAAGAMENWGLITYRETSILYDPDETSAPAHQWVAIVIAHELAHQWFGNLVTMKWWNDLWLNEGFASFLEYLGVDHVMPGWKMMEQFILDKTQPALNLDALASSHPISVDVHDPVEIEAIFDTISYSKGASILYMLEKFLHQDVLRNGLNDYLNTHMYGNAETKDLWNVLSKNANQSLEVKAIMDTWTRQMGFPLVTVTKKDGIVTATQKRFLLTASLENDSKIALDEGNSPFGYKWYVPLSYYTDKEASEVHHVWMNLTDVKFEVPSDVEWIKVNVNQSGFYRVMYEESMWMSIITTLHENHTVFSPADRANLIDDAFTLCRAGVLNASIALELSLYLLKEQDYVPWAAALEHFQSWSKRLSETTAYKLFLEYLKHLLGPVTRYVGWEDSGPHLQKLMRSDVLASAILCDVKETVKEATAKFRDWMNNGTHIPPNLREVVYVAGIKYGGVKEWQYCWHKYNSTGVPSERKLLLKALGVASDPWILQRFLIQSLDRNLVRPQDIKVVLAVVAANPEGRLLAWRHLKAHWDLMRATFGNGTFTLGSLISAVTSHFATEYDYQEVSQFFSDMNVGSGSRSLMQSLETIQLNIHWVKNNEDDIYSWLKNYLSR
ncbi:endoplasmic reticulum aminopeptidase 1-like isoform X3 [Schistocerca gregaria]|uniref:endoplasmic reticulum aminopeptidase 1-like isoform X3 n=1 Tax=Schistocerca gregaria TaxID=7010 RepID=UPI00211E875A|nr:endoplasmic reticulum aminopeptidase 1-like isoform X3 [Schistocerca gregaria]